MLDSVVALFFESPPRCRFLGSMIFSENRCPVFVIML